MQIKAIICDLDGTLVNSGSIHYRAFDRATQEILGKKVLKSKLDYDTRFFGMNTVTKLEKLGIHGELQDEIIERKNEIFKVICENQIKPSLVLRDILVDIKKRNILIIIATNSNKTTALCLLKSLGILDIIDLIISSNDVQNYKPEPDIYEKAIEEASKVMGCSVLPNETLVLEDSDVGMQAALNAKIPTVNIIKTGVNKVIETLKSIYRELK